MIYKATFYLLLLSNLAWGQSALEQAIKNTDILEYNISLTEKKINGITGNNLKDIAMRSNLENDLLSLKREKGRRLLMMAIEGTDVSSMELQSPDLSHRFNRRTNDFGSGLNSVMDETISKSNPAIAGAKEVAGRPLVLYRDVDPRDVFMAKEGAKEMVVYKTKDLRGKIVYKDLKGNTTNAIIQRALFAKEEVVFMDEKGNLLKGTPRAIFPDGTLEIRDHSGFTLRRQNGAYHLSDQIKAIEKGQVVMHSGRTAPVSSLTETVQLNEKERKALKALKKALCGL